MPRYRTRRKVAAGLLTLAILGGRMVGYSLARFSDSAPVSGNAITTDTLAPPTGLGATGGNSIVLNWTATTDTYASGYRILRGTVHGGPYSQIAQVTPRTTITFTDTPTSGTYYYVVRSYYQNWESVNSGEASATRPARMRLATGTYTGNALDNRAITGVGFAPDVVIIKGNNAQEAVIRTSSMAGDVSKPLVGATALTANIIQSLDSNGFTIGTNADVNTNAIAYYWVAFKAAASDMKVGSYSGNGTSQSITGFGFSPEYVIVMGAGGTAPLQRSSPMTSPFRFDPTAATSNSLNSLDADGFSVGNSSQVNTNGTAYHYVAWNVSSGTMNQSSYTGNASDNRSITGVGLQPDYMIVKSSTTGSTADRAVHRPSSLSGDSTLHFAAVANFANGIQALEADGFQLGTDGTVNTNAKTYYWIAFKDGGP
jgi:hypothetical protein